MKKILFICSANKDRSRTAEDYFSETNPNCVFDSAGTNQKLCNQLGTSYIQENQLEWADLIYVMELKHHDAIKSLFGNKYSSKVTVLGIKDVYKYGSRDLKDLLQSKLSDTFRLF